MNENVGKIKIVQRIEDFKSSRYFYKLVVNTTFVQ